MASQLQPQLRLASFRGTAFQVNDADLGAGRRMQVHEYPQRDMPWVEDLGRATREISIEGFLIGTYYIAQANRLLAALEASGGEGADKILDYFGGSPCTRTKSAFGR